jgi:membrane protease YdiL (CAAX protease family)
MNELTMHVDKLLPPPDWFMELFNRLFKSDLGVWGGILRVVILAPIVEELIFRGIIFSGFQRIYPAFWAIFFSALLFALFHLNPWQLGPTFLLGLLLGFVRLRTGSLLVSIFTHALHNGMIFLSVYYHEAFEMPNWLQSGKFQNYIASLTLLSAGLVIIWFISKKKSSDNLF